MNKRDTAIRVDVETIESYAVSADGREKIDLLLNLRLNQVTGPSTSLEQVMRETSEAARSRGVTESEVDELLRL